MAMSRGHLAAGKQRLKDKLMTIDELKSRVFQYVTNLTEQPTEAALQLLEETDRGHFFGKFSSVSEDLEKCLDTLFLLCVSLNNDEGDGCDIPSSELSSSESSEFNNRAVKQPGLPGKTETSPDTGSEHTGRKKHKTFELKEVSHQDESGFSSIQIDSESDTVQEETCKKDESVTSLSSSCQSGQFLFVQTNDAKDREERINQEEPHAFQSSPDQPGSISKDCTAIQQQGMETHLERKESIIKLKVSSGNCCDVDNEGQKSLKDVKLCNVSGKEVGQPEKRQDNGMVLRKEDGANVSGESLATLQNCSQGTDCKSFVKEQQESHLVFGSASAARMEKCSPRMWFNGEEVPLPSDSESELSSYSTSQPNRNVSHSSEDYSSKDTDLSSPPKEPPWSVMKQAEEMEGNYDFDNQPRVCTGRKRTEEEDVHGQDSPAAQSLGHIAIKKDLEKAQVTETAELGCATSGTNEGTGTVSVASSTEDLEDVLASQHCLTDAVLTPAQSCHTDEKSCQSESYIEKNSLLQQGNQSLVPVTPICHSSPIHSNPPLLARETFSPGYEDHAEVKPADIDPKGEKENMPSPVQPSSNTDGNCIRTKSSPDKATSEQDYCVSADHTQESNSSISHPPLCQSSPPGPPPEGAERLFPGDENCSESHLHQKSKEEEPNTSASSVNTTDTATVGCVPSHNSAGYSVQTNPPDQRPLPAAPVFSTHQNSSDQTNMHHCPQVQGSQVHGLQVQGPYMQGTQILGTQVQGSQVQELQVQVPQVQGPHVQSLAFSNGDSFDVVVSDIDNPSHFWIQPAGDQLNLLTEQLSLFYERSTLPPGLPYTPEVGMFCAACFTQDNTWYRGLITAVHNVEGTGIAELLSPSASHSSGPAVFQTPQTDVDILYVDYGNRERLSMSRVKKLHEQFTYLPCQALCCGLAKVMPVDDSGSWTSQQTVWFARQVLGKKLQAVIDLDRSSHSTEVDLYYSIPGGQNPQGQGSARVNISELMVSERMAVKRMPVHNAPEDMSKEVVQSGKFIDQTPGSPTVARPAQQMILNHEKMLQAQAQADWLLQQQQQELQLRRQRSCQTTSTNNVRDSKKPVPQKKDANNTEKHVAQNSSKLPEGNPVPSEEKLKKKESSVSKATTATRDAMEGMLVKEMGMKDGKIAKAQSLSTAPLPKDWEHEKADTSIDEYLDSLATVPQQAENGECVTSRDKEHCSEVAPDNSARRKKAVKTNDVEHVSQANRCESSSPKSGDIISPQWKNQIKNLSRNERKPRKRSVIGKGRGVKIFSSSGSTTSEEDDRNWWRNDSTQKQNSLHENNIKGATEQKEGKESSVKEGCSEDADEDDSIQVKKRMVNLQEDGSFLLMTSYIVDPSEFYVHPVTPDAAKIDHLMKELNKFYQEKGDVLRNITFEPCVNDICCARFSKDKTWYRAQICTVTYKRTEQGTGPPGEKQQRKSEAEGLDCCQVQVFYVDYGNFETLPVSEVLPLMPEFTEEPAHAVKCSLYGIVPIAEPGEEKISKPAWSREAAKTFADLTHFDKALVGYVKQPKPASEVQPPLQLVLVDTTGSVDMCINDELVSSGVAEMCIPAAPQPAKPSTNKSTASIPEDMNSLDAWDPRASDYLSERNSYFVDVDNAEVATMGFKSQEIPVCKFFQPGSTCWKGDSCPYQHLQDREVKVTEKRMVVCANHMVDLPPVHTLVAVEVTSVFNPGHFFVQFTYSGVPHDDLLAMAADGIDVDKPNPLDELSKEINDHYSKKVYSEREVGIVWAPGEIVIAKYSQDNQYYRARVTGVDAETQEVWVYYVDFGNKERVRESDIHPIEHRFCQLPHQAVECYLANIEPLPTDQGKPRWSKAARDAFIDLTGDKVLIAHVLSRGWNDTLYVALFDTTTETDIRIDYTLVKAGLARKVNIYNEQSVQERMMGHREGLAPG
ncbi:uncharacterized protein LOC118415482 [Branchiostoma floridae]|uniref:Uncharacterized protein LOC118415482 n=1 Tax=Branchiostoma floridae TaxID=7739 RepID=A0A9J7L4Z5_BRAFL|nr:uncharacterized protein LOC118415482 [Branchiostoma floridae]XP_035676032.1 uncharacterized protein LOC118415482 [Branchiostoma floridae]